MRFRGESLSSRNCLYFHFRGSWGSHGSFSLAGLVDDTRAAVDWIAAEESVDAEYIVLIAASTGSHPAITLGASDPRVRAIVGVSLRIEPRAFQFPRPMADEFADMLYGVTGQKLLDQWGELVSRQTRYARLRRGRCCWLAPARTTSFRHRNTRRR
ncbi:MAG: hypothetical protein ACT4P6_16425 [Gemmatimonadaceae bacterium]